MLNFRKLFLNSKKSFQDSGTLILNSRDAESKTATFYSAHSAPSIKTGSKLRRGRGGVCISLVRKSPTIPGFQDTIPENYCRIQRNKTNIYSQIYINKHIFSFPGNYSKIPENKEYIPGYIYRNIYIYIFQDFRTLGIYSRIYIYRNIYIYIYSRKIPEH